jgi:hypothetical protein
MIKTLLTGLFILTLLGCEKPPTERTQTTNPEFQVDTLFTKDGCTVYRFSDSGRNRYFVRCSTQASMHWDESCGKNCTTAVEIYSI